MEVLKVFEKTEYKYSGIDSLELVSSKVETEEGKKIYMDEMKKHRMVMIDKIKFIEGGKIKFPIKPSRDSKNDLSTKTEVADAIKFLESKIGEEFGVDRIDITTDFVGNNIKEMQKIISVFLETLSLVRDGEMMFKTIKDVTKIGNMKIRKDRRSTTVYSCEDRARLTDVRLEQRFTNLGRTEEEFSIKLGKVISSILKELEDVESKFEEVEEKYIEILSELYDEEISEGIVITFTGFVENHNYNILTRGILEGLYKHTKLKGNFKEWLKKYKRESKSTVTNYNGRRKLELMKKSDLKKFVKELKKEYKDILKS